MQGCDTMTMLTCDTMTILTCLFDRAQWCVYFGFIHTRSANAEGVIKTAEQIIIARVWRDHLEIIKGSYLGELAILPAPDAEQVAHDIALLLAVQLRDVLVRPHGGKRPLWKEWSNYIYSLLLLNIARYIVAYGSTEVHSRLGSFFIPGTKNRQLDDDC